MSVFEVLRFAVRGIGANKLRSGLTMLGILIGVAAVILLVAVGNGSARQVAARIEALGTKTLTVQGVGGSGALTPAVAKALDDPVLAPDVASVSPVTSTQATLTYQGADHSVQQFVGTYPSYFGASNSPVGTGTAFTADDLTRGRPVVVIGRTIAEEPFPGIEPIGKEITVNGALFTVVGVLKDKSSAAGFVDANNVAIAPLTAVQQALTGYGPLTSILVEARSSYGQQPASTAPAGGGFRGQGGFTPPTALPGGGSLNGGGQGESGRDTTTGTVKLVDGTTVYVETASGEVVTVRTDGQTTVLVPGSLKNLKAGDKVSVDGDADTEGSVTASSVTKTK